MAEHGIDCWLIQFARETGLRADPLGYLVGAGVTWPSAFLLNGDGRLAAAGDLAARVRSVKLPEEVEGITRAVELTEQLLERMERRFELGLSERALQAQVHAWVREAGWKFSWDEQMCPMVNFGEPAF